MNLLELQLVTTTLIYMIKAVGAVSMQGHRQPRSHS